MLPLLNLQLTTPAMANEISGTSRGMPAEGGQEPFAGFASLLEIRIADAVADGEVLPPTGSALPLSAAIELSAEVAADSQIEVQLPQVSRPEVPIESIPPDTVALAAEIGYPPTNEPLPVQMMLPAESIVAEVLPDAAPAAAATSPPWP